MGRILMLIYYKIKKSISKIYFKKYNLINYMILKLGKLLTEITFNIL